MTKRIPRPQFNPPPSRPSLPLKIRQILTKGILLRPFALSRHFLHRSIFFFIFSWFFFFFVFIFFQSFLFSFSFGVSFAFALLWFFQTWQKISYEYPFLFLKENVLFVEGNNFSWKSDLRKPFLFLLFEHSRTKEPLLLIQATAQMKPLLLKGPPSSFASSSLECFDWPKELDFERAFSQKQFPENAFSIDDEELWGFLLQALPSFEGFGHRDLKLPFAAHSSQTLTFSSIQLSWNDGGARRLEISYSHLDVQLFALKESASSSLRLVINVGDLRKFGKNDRQGIFSFWLTVDWPYSLAIDHLRQITSEQLSQPLQLSPLEGLALVHLLNRKGVVSISPKIFEMEGKAE